MSTDFLVVAGSRLYGINNPDSDYDYRGFLIVSTEINPSLFETFESNQETKIEDGVTHDTVMYSLAKFIKMCAAGQINILEILWAPDANIIYKSMIADKILQNRHLFLSKNIYRSIKGFALSEYNRAFICSDVPKKEYADKTKAFIDALSGFQLRSFEMLSMRQHLEEILGRSLFDKVEQPERVESKRREMYDKYGYDTKSAANAIRLLDQGEELLRDGKITFPCRDSNLLKDIRNGLINKDHLKHLFESYESRLNDAYNETSVPDKVDKDKINYLYSECRGLHLEKEKYAKATEFNW